MSCNSEELLSWLGLIIFIKKIINNPSDPAGGGRSLIWAPLIIPGLNLGPLYFFPVHTGQKETEAELLSLFPLYPWENRRNVQEWPLFQGKEISWLLYTLKLIQGILELEGTPEPWDKSGGLALNSSCATFRRLLLCLMLTLGPAASFLIWSWTCELTSLRLNSLPV